MIFGGIPGPLEMRTTIFPYGSPELQLMVSALTDIAHYYRLPMFGTAGGSDSKIFDEQASMECYMTCLFADLSGANLIHDVGFLDHCSVTSYDMMVLADLLSASKKLRSPKKPAHSAQPEPSQRPIFPQNLIPTVNFAEKVLFGVRSVRGLVQFGIELDDDDREELATLAANLSREFIILEDGAEPSLAIGLGFTAAGVLVVFLMLRLVRRKPAEEPSERPVTS